MIGQGLLPGLEHAAAREQLHQGAQQGDPQGHLEDGHLDHPVVPRAPRSSRPSASTRSSSTGTSPGRPRASAGVGIDVVARETLLAASAGLPRPAGRRRRARLGRRVPVAPRRGVPPVQSRDRVQAPARLAQRPVRRVQGLHGARRRAEHATARPSAGSSTSSGRRSRCRSTRWSPSRRSSALRHRRHVLRLHQPRGPRDARHRHEPDGRQVEHRRGRRGSRRAIGGMPTATGGAARSSRSRPGASA